MSFSAKTKEAMARYQSEKRCCQKAELAGIVRMNGTIKISVKERLGLEVTTENAAVARKVVRLAKENYPVETEIFVEKKRQLRKNNRYSVHITGTEGVKKLLLDAGIIDADMGINSSVGEKINAKRCCTRSFLRGVFLGSGSINEPDNAYHLEINVTSEEFAISLIEMMEGMELSPRYSVRKNRFIVYLKESEQISTFLNLIGAHNSLLELENIRIQKGLRNQVNRLVNCETANLSKTVDAAFRQRESIEYLARTIGLDKLPDGLREVALLRLSNPEMSLKELGESLQPPLGKSGINHRMRKIEELAEKMQNDKKTLQK